MANRMMQRLCSIPSLRWRGRIKQFERDVYDNWVGDIDRSIWASWLDRWVASFSREIPEDSAILDVGCGTGRALLILAGRRPPRLAGIDIAPKAIEVATCTSSASEVFAGSWSAAVFRLSCRGVPLFRLVTRSRRNDKGLPIRL